MAAARMRRTKGPPPSTGIATSVTTHATARSACRMRHAASPSGASTTSKPRERRARTATRRTSMSSSTISTCSWPTVRGAAAAGSPSGAGAVTRGRYSVNVAPRPGSLCTPTTPPCCAAIP